MRKLFDQQHQQLSQPRDAEKHVGDELPAEAPLSREDPQRLSSEWSSSRDSPSSRLLSAVDRSSEVKLERGDVAALADCARIEGLAGRRLAGSLVKRGAINTRSWRRRWFVLRPPFLFYFKVAGGEAVGAVLLEGASADLLSPSAARYQGIVAAASDKNAGPESAVIIVSSCSGREYVLVADAAEDARRWRDGLQAATRPPSDALDAALACATAMADLARTDAERSRAEVDEVRRTREDLEAELIRSKLDFERSMADLRSERDTALAALGVEVRNDRDANRKSDGGLGLRIWVGTWNLGATEPLSRPRQRARAGEILRRGLLPAGCDVYCLGVQEAASESLFEAVESLLSIEDVERLSPPVRQSRRRNARRKAARPPRQRFPVVDGFAEEDDEGYRRDDDDDDEDDHDRQSPPPPTASDGLLDADEERLASACAAARGRDRVEGRGDGSLLGTKFTGLAVFAKRHLSREGRVRMVACAAHCVQPLSSKGAAACVLQVDDATICFATGHLEAKRAEERRRQARDVVNVLGGALSERPSLDLTTICDHVLFFADLNFRLCVGGSGSLKRATEPLDPDAAVAVLQGRDGCRRALATHDQLDVERRAEEVFYGFAEPVAPPDFCPTYKIYTEAELAKAPPAVHSPGWASRTYVTRFREPLYKGGRTKDRTPGFCDRVLVRSLDDDLLRLVPERAPFGRLVANGDVQPLPDNARVAAHHYRTAHGCEGMASSDHAPVYAVFLFEPRSFRRSGSRGLKFPLEVSGDPLPACDVGAVELEIRNFRVAWGRSTAFPLAVRCLAPSPFEQEAATVEMVSAGKTVESGGWRSMAAGAFAAEALRGGESRGYAPLDALRLRLDDKGERRSLSTCHLIFRVAVPEGGVDRSLNDLHHVPLKERLRAARFAQCAFPLRRLLESNAESDHVHLLERDGLPFYAVDPTDMARHRVLLHFAAVHTE